MRQCIGVSSQLAFRTRDPAPAVGSTSPKPFASNSILRAQKSLAQCLYSINRPLLYRIGTRYHPLMRTQGVNCVPV